MKCTIPAPRVALADRDGLAIVGPTLHTLRGIRFLEGEGGAGAGGTGDAGGDGADGTGSGDSGDAGAGTGDGTDALGDAGKQALDRMKAERNAARDELRAFKALGLTAEQIRALKDAPAGAGEQPDASAIEQRVRDSVAAELRERSATKFRALAVRDVARDLGFIDPGDALPFLPQDALTAVAVDENDDVDRAAVTTLLEALAKAKPHLIQTTTSDWRAAGIGGAGSGTVPEVSPGQARIAHAYASTTPKK